MKPALPPGLRPTADFSRALLSTTAALSSLPKRPDYALP